MGSRSRKGGDTAPAGPARPPGITLHPLVLALGGALVLLIGFAGGYMVALNVGQAPRGQAPAREAAAPVSPELAALADRLQRDPNDVQALLRLAHVHLDQGQTGAARAMYDRVLQLEARNVEAITHLGNVAAAEGRVDEALRRYDEALALDPQYAHALWDKAITLQEQKGDPRAAVPLWEAFLKVMPPGSADVQKAQEMLAEARKAAGGGASAPRAAATVAKAEAVAPANLVGRGKALYEQWGCARCHAIAGRGGVVGPDLTRAAAKGRDLEWHIRHLKDPAAVTPGSVMPPVQGASEDELRAVAAYMLSLK